jgi:mRNA-degrading endonuclease RelE of RelBE toxin-antitoxin system
MRTTPDGRCEDKQSGRSRRGAYLVIYRIDEAERIVHVVRIDHRMDVYRPG